MRGVGLLLAWALGAIGAAQAKVIDIAWDAQGHFAHDSPVAPGQFVEVCGPVAQGQTIAWRFEASAPMDFNIHYHVDQSVVYPVRQPGLTQERGQLRAQTDQNYCWMWTNTSAQTAQLTLRLQREL